jgi:WD40 repeat protein
VSGSRDGVAHIWYFERQHWHNIPLKMSERLPGSDAPVNEEVSRKVRVSMVGWTCDDVHVITSLSDHSLKVWFSQTGQLRHILYGHEEEVFVIEAHPKDSRIFLSGGHDGAIILWDVISGTSIKTVRIN